MRALSKIAFAIGIIAIAPAAFAQGTGTKGIVIEEPSARATPSGAETGALYMTLDNRSAAADRLHLRTNVQLTHDQAAAVSAAACFLMISSRFAVILSRIRDPEEDMASICSGDNILPIATEKLGRDRARSHQALTRGRWAIHTSRSFR